LRVPLPYNLFISFGIWGRLTCKREGKLENRPSAVRETKFPIPLIFPAGIPPPATDLLEFRKIQILTSAPDIFLAVQ
jgi:hypothetical protein